MVATETNAYLHHTQNQHHRNNYHNHHQSNNYSSSSGFYAPNDRMMMAAATTTTSAVPRNQLHREEMSEDAAVEHVNPEYQIVRIDDNLPLEAFKTNFVDHYKTVHYELDEADSLYLPDAVRAIEVINGSKCEKKHFKNPQILDSYKHYAIRDIVIDYTTIHRTNYLIFMTIVGKCKFRGQECHMNLDLVQNANEDQDDMSVSYLIAYERLVINTSGASNVETHKIEKQQTFNFGSKKSAHSKVIMQNSSNQAPSTTAAPVSRSMANKQQHHSQNGTYEHNFDPIISSNSHSNAVHANVPSTMSEDHEDRFSIQSQQQVQQKEKNFSSSRVGAKSVPLMTDQSDKKEDMIDSRQYSKYSSLMGQNRAVPNNLINSIVNPSNEPAEATEDGEQRMPKSEDKFQSRGRNMNYENSSRNRNGARQNTNMKFSKNEIYVVNFDDHVSDDQIKASFSKFGEVKNVFLKKNSKSNGYYAHVRFATEEEAKCAVEENDKLEIDGKPVTIKYKSYNENSRFGGMRGERSDRSGDRRPYTKRSSSGQNSPKKSNANNSQAPDDNNTKDW